MDNKEPISDAMAGLFYHAANISKYSEEEFNALYQSATMTQEIFNKCIETALAIYDFENIKYLIKKYPDFAVKNPALKDWKM